MAIDPLDDATGHVNAVTDEIDLIAGTLENETATDDAFAKMSKGVAAIRTSLEMLNGSLDALTKVDEPDADNIARLHEAICEGRKQDAIDLLGELFPDAPLRAAATQNFLFPDRIIS